jgi:hypothetical protein
VHNEDTLVNARARLVSNIGHKCFEEFARKIFQANVLKNLQKKNFPSKCFGEFAKKIFQERQLLRGSNKIK